MNDRKEDGEVLSYTERMSQARDKAKEDIKAKKAKKVGTKLNLTDVEERFAAALGRLSSNQDFKLFLELENIEIAKRMAESFEVHSSMAKATFGEQMAFNKGRSHQAHSFRNSRSNLLNRYIDKIDKEAKHGKG